MNIASVKSIEQRITALGTELVALLMEQAKGEIAGTLPEEDAEVQFLLDDATVALARASAALRLAQKVAP